MAEQEPISSITPVRLEKSRHSGRVVGGTDDPAEEATAAIIAVLSLMQTEAPLEATTPPTSAWGQAGRRESVRPWSGKE